MFVFLCIFMISMYISKKKKKKKKKKKSEQYSTVTTVIKLSDITLPCGDAGNNAIYRPRWKPRCLRGETPTNQQWTG